MKLGIIGTGFIVQDFLPGLKKLEGLELTAMLSTPRSRAVAEELCQQHGIKNLVTDFEDLCKTGIDTVYVAVPNFLHYEFSKKALQHGLNVICEKPLTANYAEAQELAALAEKEGRLLFEAITSQYMGTFLKIREWLPRVGAVKVVQSQYTQYSSRYDKFKAGEVLPVFDPQKAGGALMDLGLYCLHFIIGLFGAPEKVVYLPNIERGIDTSGMMVLSYDGFQALALAAKDCKGNAFSIVQGDKGLIRCDSAPNTMGKVVLELNDGTREEFDDHSSEERQMAEFRAFIKAIDENDKALCRKMMQQSLAVVKVQTEGRLGTGIRFPGD